MASTSIHWRYTVVAIAAVFAMPIVFVLSSLFTPASEVWRHLVDTRLADYTFNSLMLMLGVGVGVLLGGVSTAWLTVNFDFCGRRFFVWALLLPLAMPAYIIAYAYTGLLEFSGPVQTGLRSVMGWQGGDYWFPQVRSLSGAMFMLTFVLYPYVYLLARSAFLEQSVAASDAGRLLGCTPWQNFWRVTLPMARPAVIAGLSLALMETLADYGTVQYFGVDTFTTGIFRTWFGLGDSSAATQLSAVLMMFVFALIMLEYWSRRRSRFHHIGSREIALQRTRLTSGYQLAAFVWCVAPIILGFLIPFGLLLYWSWITADEMLDQSFFMLAGNSFTLAGMTALLAVLFSLIMIYGRRLAPTRIVRAAVRVTSLGYAIPGTVIAVGVVIPMGWLDNTINDWLEQTLGVTIGLIFSGTLVTLVFAYLVRFLAISQQAVGSGLSTVRPHMDDAARSLGLGPRKVLTEIHIPMIRGSMLTAGLIVFVDVLKELPATLILRPFNFNTLAVRAYELASDERLMDSATAAAAIVLVGLIPVILLSRTIETTRTVYSATADQPV
ncbi:MAG: iron ABC transporter permease [Arenicellales bacterium]|nr:iron ABC transporter permease [Arenicellales bacterium]